MLTAIIAGLFVAFGLAVAFGIWFYARGRSLREAGRDYEGKVQDVPPRRSRPNQRDDRSRPRPSGGP